MVRVEIYAKPGCASCADAQATLLGLKRELPFELTRVDVTLDPAVARRYERDVPVVFIDGRRAFQGRVPEREARRRLERALAQTEGSQAGESTPIPPRTLRNVKVAFMAVAILAIAGVLVTKAYDLLVGQPARVEEAFLVGPEGGGRIAGDLPAPDLRLETPDGKPFTLSDARGEVLLLNFWATWCPPCREEMPAMLRLGAELARAHPGKFRMVAVSVDEGWDPVKGFFGSALPAEVLVVLDRDQKATRAYFCAARGRCPGNFQFPESYIVDKRGRLVAFVVSGRNWSEPVARRILEKLIES